jgi:hypothetical protein
MPAMESVNAVAGGRAAVFLSCAGAVHIFIACVKNRLKGCRRRACLMCNGPARQQNRPRCGGPQTRPDGAGRIWGGWPRRRLKLQREGAERARCGMYSHYYRPRYGAGTPLQAGQCKLKTNQTTVSKPCPPKHFGFLHLLLVACCPSLTCVGTHRPARCRECSGCDTQPMQRLGIDSPSM